VGRFLSIDPALGSASPQQLNGYSYAADNPATSSDPTGLYLPDEGGPCYSAFELGCTDAADQNPPLTISSVAAGAASEVIDIGKSLLSLIASVNGYPPIATAVNSLPNPIASTQPDNPSFGLGLGIVYGLGFLIPGGDEAAAVDIGADTAATDLGIGAAAGAASEPAGAAGAASERLAITAAPERLAITAGDPAGVATAGIPARGVTFFDQSTADYYKVANATLGRPGGATFFMSEGDSALVTNSSNAARYSGMAPSVQRAYVNGEPIYGVNFPTAGLDVRTPTAADAGGFEHFLEGGQTAVRLADDGGYLVNPVQEFVTPGGLLVPAGSFLFELSPAGGQILLRTF
jgi:hypothetical protein